MLITAVLLTLVLVVVLWWAIPWGSYPSNLVVDPATKDFTPSQIQDAHQLRTTLRWLSLTPWLMTLILTLVAGVFGSRIDLAPSAPAWLRIAMTVLSFSLLLTLVRLPFSIASLNVSRRAGLSTTSWSTWILDLVKGFLISAALTSAALILLAWAARRWQEWWLPAALGAAGVAVLLSFLMPVLLEPIFNKFTPMAEGPLRTSMIQLSERDGVRVSDVLVADASRRTTALNAYVSGFGSTRRIVVYDTLLRDAPQAEVESVVAHELSHAKENDVLVGTLIGAIAAALGVIALALILGVKVADPRYALSVIAVITALSVLQQPVASAMSREVEKRADVHALELTRNPATFAQMQKRLALTNRADLLTPRWLYLFFGTHPSTMERISFSRSWAERHGQIPPASMAQQ